MSFPQFVLLPPELQLKIWAFSLAAPRVVDLFAVPVSESLQPRFAPAPKNPATSSLNQDHSSSESRNEDDNANSNEEEDRAPAATIWIRTFIERIYTSPQDLGCLHICSEARKIALKSYLRVNADTNFLGDMQFECLPTAKQSDEHETMFCLGTLKGDRPYALLDPWRDIVFLQDPPEMRDAIGGLVISSMEILLRWLGTKTIHSLRRLAIPYYTWRKTKNAVGLKLLLEFEGLEELYVSFLGDNYTGSYRATWSDMVGELWSHVREVEEEVQADVEWLKRRYPEWKAPKVRVVKHRGVLMEDIDG